MEKVEIKHFKVLQLPVSAEKNSIYYVLDSERNRVKTYITDNSGIPIPLIDLKGEGIVESVSGTGVTGTTSNPKIDIVSFVSSEIGNLVKVSVQDGKIKVNRITSPDLSLEVVNTENELQLQIASELIEKINNALQPEDITQYTDEDAQDAVGTIFIDTSTIDLNYNDTTPQISASVKQNSITSNELSYSVNTSLNLANTSVQPLAIQNFFNKIIDDTDDITEGTIKKFVTDVEKNFWNLKQDALISETNIKTINGNSLLGSGNVEVKDYIEVDSYSVLISTAGVSEKIYLTRDDNKLYRFNGTIYVSLGSNLSNLTNNTIPVYKDGILQDSTFSLDETYASPGNPLDNFNFRNVIKGNDNGFTNPLNFAMAINDNIDRPIYAFGNSGRFNVYDYTGNGGTAVLYNLADVPMFYVGHYAFAGKNSNGKVNTTNIVGAKIINNTASAMSSVIELQYMTDCDTSTEHAQPNQVVSFSKNGFRLPNIPIVPDSGTQIVTGNLTATNNLTSNSSLVVVKAGSNTIGAGANVNLQGAGQSRQYFMQLNASGGIEHHFFNGSTFVTPSSLSNTGVFRLSTLAGTGQRVVTANASGELSNTSPESFIVRAAGSDTPAAGARYSLSNLTSTQIGITQLSASGGVDYYVFNGSAFVKYLGVTNLGAISVGTTITVPNATLAGQAVNKGQLDLKANLASPALTGTPTAPTPTAGTNTTQIANTLFVNNSARSREGWASYSTTTYTNASPFTVAPNSTVTLLNNANNSIIADLPLGVTAFYNGTTNKITPVAIGDSYTVNVRFKARTTMNNDYLTLFIDIGAGTQINAEAKQFLKGANTEQPFSFTMPIFTLTTFLTNGGEIKISSNGGTISIYDITYFIIRNYTR